MRAAALGFAALCAGAAAYTAPVTMCMERRAFLGAIAAGPVLAAASEANAVQRRPPPQRIQLPPEDEPSKLEDMPALRGLDYGKPRTKYPDFTSTPSGLQFKDVKAGSGAQPSRGDRVVVDWEGYTIGFYGRPFQLKSAVQGGAFAGDTDLLRFTLGDGSVIAGLDEAVATMKEGGIRQIIVPVELSYPETDRSHDKVGPKPATFSGTRALDFVLQNSGMIDKTLLFNVELKRVDKPGQRGFRARGAA